MSKHVYTTANLTDEELKNQGNRLFSGKKYEEAVNCYTKAIVSITTLNLLTLNITQFFNKYKHTNWVQGSMTQ